MKSRGFILSSIFLLLSLVTFLTVLAPMVSDFAVHRADITGGYAKLDAARNVGLDAGEAWIITSIHKGYAPRAIPSHGSAGTPTERISARFADGSEMERLYFPGGIEVDVFVGDLDYPPELFGVKGSNIPRLPVSVGEGETGRYYLIRSAASDPSARALRAEALFLVSVDLFGAISGARRIFYRSW